jgi:hypothetical protein
MLSIYRFMHNSIMKRQILFHYPSSTWKMAKVFFTSFPEWLSPDPTFCYNTWMIILNHNRSWRIFQSKSLFPALSIIFSCSSMLHFEPFRPNFYLGVSI